MEVLAPGRAAWLTGAAIGLLLVIAPARPVLAHALLKTANPEPGTAVETSPSRLTITFNEIPDPSLSRVQVTDSGGGPVTAASTLTDPDDPFRLTLPLPPLAAGVYTVTWRTVSAVDGHLTTGTYAFGVGPASVAPVVLDDIAGTAAVQPLAVVGHWMLFVGLAGMLGAATLVRLVDQRAARSTVPLVAAGLGIATIGTCLVFAAQVVSTGLEPIEALGSSVGTRALARSLPLLLASGGLVMLIRDPTAPRRAMALVGAGAAMAMLADVVASHAAAGGDPWLTVPIGWLHIMGVGIWLGGIAALLLGMRAVPGPRTGRMARGFAWIATVGICLVAITGMLRAAGQLGSVDALTSTPFGQLVVAKSVLFVGLAALGATNHVRNVPIASSRPRGLRRVGRTELVIGCCVLMLAAALVEVAPPSPVPTIAAGVPRSSPTAAMSPAVGALVAVGEDPQGSVQITLEVTPGTPGTNTFHARLQDADIQRPAPADALSLAFQLPGRPELESRLDLASISPGVFDGSGAELVAAGPWTVSATFSDGTSTVQIPLLLPVVTAGGRVDVQENPGLPTIAIAHTETGGTIQVYVDPGMAGPNQVHVTFFGADGTELPVTEAVLVASGSLSTSRASPVELDARLLEPGHLVATTRASTGAGDLYVFGLASDGGTISARVPVHVDP